MSTLPDLCGGVEGEVGRAGQAENAKGPDISAAAQASAMHRAVHAARGSILCKAILCAALDFYSSIDQDVFAASSITEVG